MAKQNDKPQKPPSGSTPNNKKISSYRARVRGDIETLKKKYRNRSALSQQRGYARHIGLPAPGETGPAEYVKGKNKGFFDILLNGMLLDNPVFFNAIGIVLIISFASTLERAWLFSLVAAVLTVVTEVFASLFYRRFSFEMRMTAYIMTSAVVLLPLGTAVLNANLSQVTAMGTFLPLICVSGLVTVRAETYGIRNNAAAAFVDALGNALGFMLVALLVGAIREILSVGTLGGAPLNIIKPIGPGVNLPFFSFLLIGMLTALAKHLRSRYIKNKERNNNSGGGDRP